VSTLLKQAKKREKAKGKVSIERAKLDEVVKKKNVIAERLKSTKTIDDLNERESELWQQNAKDQAIIDATDTSPSEREAAEARVEKETRSSRVWKLRSQIEKPPCLSKKESKKSSKNTA